MAGTQRGVNMNTLQYVCIKYNVDRLPIMGPLLTSRRVCSLLITYYIITHFVGICYFFSLSELFNIIHKRYIVYEVELAIIFCNFETSRIRRVVPYVLP